MQSNVLERPGSSLKSLALAAALLCGAGLHTASAEPIQLRVAGGLAGVSQYERFEEPFWRDEVPRLTHGQVQVQITPFDKLRILSQSGLKAIRSGEVEFGTALIAAVSAEELEVALPELPLLNPDTASARRTVESYRPYLTRLLHDYHNAELLAVYTYPSQVVFCRRPFTGISDLKGRRVRVSGAAQHDLMLGVGATPVNIPFNETAGAMRMRQVDCAITGTLSGNSIGLHEAASYVQAMAVTSGISVFAAHRPSWEALPENIRQAIRSGLVDLEKRIWEAAAKETEEGLVCNSGSSDCHAGARGSMTIVPPDSLEVRRDLLRRIVLPKWVIRCGNDCVDAWNQYLSEPTGIRLTTSVVAGDTAGEGVRPNKN